MPDVLALLDAAIEDLGRRDRVPVVPVTQSVTGTVNSLIEKGNPAIPVVPAEKQDIVLDTDISPLVSEVCTNPQEDAPIYISSKSTVSTVTAGSGQDFRGVQSSRCVFANGNERELAARPDEPKPAPSQPACVPSTPFDEAAAVAAGVPRAWAEGVARLQAMACPRGIDPERWRQVADDARRFIERRAVEAAALGWDTVNVFGVHPLKPAARTDCMGLVWLLRGREVIEITPETARIGLPSGAAHTYSRRDRPEAVPVWQLGGGGTERSALRRLLVCCQCGEAMVGPVSAWLGGEPVHRECGERASARPESTAGAVEAAA